jgi:hypothetical protein
VGATNIAPKAKKPLIVFNVFFCDLLKRTTVFAVFAKTCSQKHHYLQGRQIYWISIFC